MAKLDYTYTLLPRFSDTDAYGILHHSSYLLFLEEAKLAMMHDPNYFAINVMDDPNIKYVVESLTIKYIRAWQYNPASQIVVKLQLEVIADVYLQFNFEMFADNTCLSRGECRHIAVKDGQMCLRLPQHLKQTFDTLVKTRIS